MKRFAVAFAVIGLVLSNLALPTHQPALAQTANSYTNAAWGYTVTWNPNAWYEVSRDDAEDGSDLVLSNGVSFVTFAYDTSVVDHRECVSLFENGIGQREGISNVQPVLDESGAEVRQLSGDRAYLALSYTIAIENQEAEVAERFECRPLVPNQAILIIDMFVIPADQFTAESQLAEELLTGLSIPGADATPEAATATPEVTVAPTLAPTEESEPTAEPTGSPAANASGEIGPVFVANGWRVSVIGAVRSPGLNAIGLSRRDDRDWFVVIADITNWSDEDASLTPRDIRLQFPESETPVRAATNSSRTVAENLRLALSDIASAQTFRPNQTRRAVLVYSVASEFTTPTLTFGSSLPIADVLDREIDFNDLPAIQRPPALTTAEVDQIPDGQSLNLFFPETEENQTITLAGVIAPADGDCFDDESASQLSQLAGSTVSLESAADGTYFVWAENDEGQRVSLNYEMVASGFALVSPNVASPFATWLNAAEAAAQDAESGLWGACADELPNADASPVAEITPTESVPTATVAPSATPTTEATLPSPSPTVEPTTPPTAIPSPSPTRPSGSPEASGSASPVAKGGTTEESTAAMFRGGPAHTGVQPGPGLGAPATIPWEFQTTSTIFSSPAIVDGVVYIGSLDGSVYALDSNSGPARWQFATGDGILSSPAVANGVVYIGSEDMNLYAIDAATGRERWRFATGAAVSSSPAVVNGIVYVGGNDTYVYAIGAETGTEVWKSRLGPTFGSPAVVDGILYIGSGQTLYALDASTGSERWSTPTGSSVQSSPAVSGSLVVVGNDTGTLLAVDRATGEERWRFSATDAILSSPAIANNIVYVGSNDQHLYAIDATTGEEVWNYQAGDSITASPAIADGVVYVGSYDGFIYGLDAATGAKRWEFQAGPILSSAVVVDDVVYFAGADGRVLARRPFSLLRQSGPAVS